MSDNIFAQTGLRTGYYHQKKNLGYNIIRIG